MKNKFNKLIPLLLVLSVLVIGFSPIQENIIPVQANDVPRTEILDLNIDGSTPTTVSTNFTHFDYAMRIIFFLEWTDNVGLNFDEFASDTALTNGIRIMYANQSLLNGFNITMNHDFAKFAYDTRVDIDERSPKGYILYSRFSFFKILQEGMVINSSHNLEFIIQDDMTALSITGFEVQVQGCTSCFEPTTQAVSEVSPVSTIWLENTGELTVSVWEPTTAIQSTTGTLEIPINQKYFEHTDKFYYQSSESNVKIKGLTKGNDYALLLGSNLNTNDYKWINFTADHEIEIIIFTFSFITGSPHVLEYKLYFNDVELESDWRGMILTEDQNRPENIEGWIANNWSNLILFIFMMAMAIVFIRRK